MIKKILTISLGLLLACTLASCGGGKDPSSDSSISSSSASSTGGNSSSSTSSGSGPVTIGYTDATIKQALTTLENNGGYSVEIEMKSSSNSEAVETTNLKLEAKDGVNHYVCDDTDMWYQIGENSYSIYSKDDGVWEKQEIPYSGTFTKEYAQQSFSTLSGQIFGLFSQYTQSGVNNFTKGGSQTIAGQVCVKYSCVILVAGVSLNYNYYINEATGLCLKYDVSTSNGMSSGSFSFECKSFTKNITLTLPTAAPAPIELTKPVVTISSSGVATWPEITNAAGYKYKINGGAELNAPTNREVQLVNGDYIFVKAIGNGTTYTDSEWSSVEVYVADPVITPITLTTPVVSISTVGVATWPEVINALGYKYMINDGVETTAPTNRSVTLTDGQSIKVKAIGDGTVMINSAWSVSQTYTAPVVTPTTLATPVVSISAAGVATWPEDTNASGYKYKIDDGEETNAPANRSVTLTANQTIKVMAIGDGTTYNNSAWSTVKTFGVSLTSIEVAPSSQAKVSFAYGEAFTANGLKVRYVYSDGSMEVVTAEASWVNSSAYVPAHNLTTEQQYTISVTIPGKGNTSYTVTVAPKPAVVVTIDSSSTAKTVFAYGETFNATGLVVKYSDSETPVTAEASWINADAYNPSHEMATVQTYRIVVTTPKGVVSYDVTVAAEPTCTVAIDATSNHKTTFAYGESFSASGLKIKYDYTDDDLDVVNNVVSSWVNSSTYIASHNQGTMQTYTIVITTPKGAVNYDVTVAAKPTPALTGIVVDQTSAHQTEFINGANFSATGLVIVAKYNNGGADVTLEASDYEIDLTAYNAIKNHVQETKQSAAITIKYLKPGTVDEYVTTTYGVFVNPVTMVTNIEVAGSSTQKVEFQWGESFDATDLLIKASYNVGSPVYVNYDDAGIVYDLADYNSKKNHTEYTSVTATIGVTYAGKTTSYEVDIFQRPAPVSTSISVSPTSEHKVDFNYGEDFSYDNLLVLENFDYGDPQELLFYGINVVSSEFVSDHGFFTPQTYTIHVYYNSFQTSYNVTVAAKPVKMVGIEIDTSETSPKSSFNVGEAFAATGLVIKGIYNNGTSAVLTADQYQINSEYYNKESTGSYAIIISASEDEVNYYCQYTVLVVNSAATVSSIAMSTPAELDHTQYVGQALNPSGLTVVINYSDETTQYVNLPDPSFVITNFTSETAGTKTITITGLGKTITCDVKVINDYIASINCHSGRIQFYLGEAFVPTNLVVTAYYATGKTGVIDNTIYALDSSTYNANVADSYRITISVPNEALPEFPLSTEYYVEVVSTTKSTNIASVNNNGTEFTKSGNAFSLLEEPGNKIHLDVNYCFGKTDLYAKLTLIDGTWDGVSPFDSVLLIDDVALASQTYNYTLIVTCMDGESATYTITVVGDTPRVEAIEVDGFSSVQAYFLNEAYSKNDFTIMARTSNYQYYTLKPSEYTISCSVWDNTWATLLEKGGADQVIFNIVYTADPTITTTARVMLDTQPNSNEIKRVTYLDSLHDTKNADVDYTDIYPTYVVGLTEDTNYININLLCSYANVDFMSSKKASGDAFVKDETLYWGIYTNYTGADTYYTVRVTAPNGSIAYYYIKIVEAQLVISSIDVDYDDANTTFFKGESFDSTGIVVTGNFSDGTNRVLTPAEYTVLTPCDAKNSTILYDSSISQSWDVKVILTGDDSVYDVYYINTLTYSASILTSLTINGDSVMDQVDLKDNYQTINYFLGYGETTYTVNATMGSGYAAYRSPTSVLTLPYVGEMGSSDSATIGLMIGESNATNEIQIMINIMPFILVENIKINNVDAQLSPSGNYQIALNSALLENELTWDVAEGYTVYVTDYNGLICDPAKLFISNSGYGNNYCLNVIENSTHKLVRQYAVYVNVQFNLCSYDLSIDGASYSSFTVYNVGEHSLSLNIYGEGTFALVGNAAWTNGGNINLVSGNNELIIQITNTETDRVNYYLVTICTEAATGEFRTYFDTDDSDFITVKGFDLYSWGGNVAYVKLPVDLDVSTIKATDVVLSEITAENIKAVVTVDSKKVTITLRTIDTDALKGYLYVYFGVDYELNDETNIEIYELSYEQFSDAMMTGIAPDVSPITFDNTYSATHDLTNGHLLIADVTCEVEIKSVTGVIFIERMFSMEVFGAVGAEYTVVLTITSTDLTVSKDYTISGTILAGTSHFISPDAAITVNANSLVPSDFTVVAGEYVTNEIMLRSGSGIQLHLKDSQCTVLMECSSTGITVTPNNSVGNSSRLFIIEGENGTAYSIKFTVTDLNSQVRVYVISGTVSEGFVSTGPFIFGYGTESDFTSGSPLIIGHYTVDNSGDYPVYSKEMPIINGHCIGTHVSSPSSTDVIAPLTEDDFSGVTISMCAAEIVRLNANDGAEYFISVTIKNAAGDIIAKYVFTGICSDDAIYIK